MQIHRYQLDINFILILNGLDPLIKCLVQFSNTNQLIFESVHRLNPIPKFRTPKPTRYQGNKVSRNLSMVRIVMGKKTKKRGEQENNYQNGGQSDNISESRDTENRKYKYKMYKLYQIINILHIYI